MKNVKFFRTIVCNFLLLVIVVLVFAYSLYMPLQTAFSGEKLKPIYMGNSENNKVCLMFNVYWGTEFLDGILECLEKENVKTTFFVGGTWVANENDMFKKIISKGHEIGNHGYNHKEHEQLSRERNKEEISICHEVVKTVGGVDMKLFAPPSGSYSQITLEVAISLGYKVIMWSRDTIDWRDKDANLIYTRATKEIIGGELVLMHPTQKTLEALPNILNYLSSHNLVASTVSEVIS